MAPELTDRVVGAHGVPGGRVTVLRRADCPHGEQAIRAIERFADGVSLRVQVDDVVVETEEEARASGCQGSPTILMAGRDIDPDARGGTSFGVT